MKTESIPVLTPSARSIASVRLGSSVVAVIDRLQTLLGVVFIAEDPSRSAFCEAHNERIRRWNRFPTYA